jgi:hypothetical protein
LAKPLEKCDSDWTHTLEIVVRLEALKNDNKTVVFLQHHPFAMPIYIPEIIYSFSYEVRPNIYVSVSCRPVPPTFSCNTHDTHDTRKHDRTRRRS